MKHATALHRATAFALALLCALQLLALWRAPAAWAPASIKVRLAPGEALVLGGAELAAPRAADAHLWLRRDGSGNWMAAAAEGASALRLLRDGGERRSGSTLLDRGRTFSLGGVRFSVMGVEDGALHFEAQGSHWRYDGATLYRDGDALPACPGSHWAGRVAGLWNRVAPQALGLPRAVSLGGNLHCDNRLGIAHADAGSATIGRTNDGYLLSAGVRDMLPVMMDEDPVPLAQQEVAIAGIDALALGATTFALQVSGGELVLEPSGRVSLSSAAEANLPAAVSWQWRKLPPWQADYPVTPLLVLALAIAFARGRGAWPFRDGALSGMHACIAVSCVLAIAGAASLALQRSGTPPAAGTSMLLGGAALWSWLLLPGRLSLSSASALLLLGFGLLVQMELGLGAPDTSWLRYFHKTAALAALGLGLGALVYLRHAVPVRLAPMPSQVRVEWGLALLAATALGALALQVVLGDETGVFGLQPVEFAKLALVALTAHCMAVGTGWREAGALRWLHAGLPVLVFSALLGIALVQVDDFSPLVLLLVWSGSMALAFALACRSLALGALVLLCAAAACALLAWLRTQAPGSDWSFYGDRFHVWIEPLRHPHTGQQVLQGARAIAEGAWLGADRLLGLASLGDASGMALDIPAVQDDFAPSFLLYRHGLAGALALWLLQSAFLAGLLASAVRSFAASHGVRDFRQAWRFRFRCFALCGGAGFVLGHLILSWGTNLAILPVMGQPMSFLSAGGSHLLFFICPLLVLGAISSQPFEEIEPCRSTSNTRSWAT